LKEDENPAVRIDLEEANQQLNRFFTACKIANKHVDPIHNAWHQRNLIAPWTIEKLLEWEIKRKGLDEGYLGHDFKDKLDILFGENSLETAEGFKILKNLNIRTGFHYPSKVKMSPF